MDEKPKNPKRFTSRIHGDIAARRIESGVETLRGWVTQSWKIALLMGKGAYLLSERRKLFTQMGEEVYYKIQKGEFANEALSPIVKQIDRLTKKIELEEMQIRTARYGDLKSDDITPDAVEPTL